MELISKYLLYRLSEPVFASVNTNNDNDIYHIMSNPIIDLSNINGISSYVDASPVAYTTYAFNENIEDLRNQINELRLSNDTLRSDIDYLRNTMNTRLMEYVSNESFMPMLMDALQNRLDANTLNALYDLLIENHRDQ